MLDTPIVENQATKRVRKPLIGDFVPSDLELQDLPLASTGNDDQGILIHSAKTLLLDGKFSLCLEFLQGVPRDILRTNPLLEVYKATAMLYSEFPQIAIKKVLENIETSPGADSVLGEVITIKAILQSYSEGPVKGIQLSKQALQHLKPDDLFFINLVERNLGIAYTLKNDLRNANTWFERLLLTSHKLQDSVGILAAYNYLTYIRKVQGRFTEASVIYKKALDFIEDQNLQDLPHSIKIFAGYGHLLLLWHQIKDAIFYLKQAIELAKQTDILYAQTAFQHLSTAMLWQKDIHSALSLIHQSQEYSEGLDDLYKHLHAQYSQTTEALINLEIGEIESAYDWLVTTGIDQLSKESLRYHFDDALGYQVPIAARIFCAKGMCAEAFRLLNLVIPKFLQQGANSYLIRTLNALAVVYAQMEDRDRAQDAIHKALQLGQKENNIGDFLIIGSDLIPILSFHMQTSCSTEYAQRIISLLTSTKIDPCSHSTSECQNPLSPRETDVLELIATGMTNREIALTLYLSANTIKSHSISIYRKLDVNNRNQAVNKARSLGILPLASLPIINTT